LDAFDRVPARGERFAPVRGCGDNRDAGVTDFETSNPVMQSDTRARPTLPDFADDSLERLQCERLVRLVLEIPDTPGAAVVPHYTEKGDHGAVGAFRSDGADEAAQLERIRSDRKERLTRHVFSIRGLWRHGRSARRGQALRRRIVARAVLLRSA